jgi:hypothetical protein
MTTLIDASDYSHAFTPSLSLAALRQRAPAAFAGNASPRTKQTYRFISNADVLSALLNAGFEASEAQQTRSRAGTDPTYARHMIRLRMARQNLMLVDAIPNVILVASHDGTSAYIRLILICHHWHKSARNRAYLRSRRAVAGAVTVLRRISGHLSDSCAGTSTELMLMISGIRAISRVAAIPGERPLWSESWMGAGHFLPSI